MKTRNGFTLIELLITVAVIGILAAVAYPSYNTYVIRGKLAEATAALSDARVKMEQYFQDNRRYDSPTIPLAANGCPTALRVPAATTNFTFTCTGLSTTAYAIVATGTGGVTGFIYTIDQTNTKRTTAAPTGWMASTMPATCWISRKGGLC